MEKFFKISVYINAQTAKNIIDHKILSIVLVCYSLYHISMAYGYSCINFWLGLASQKFTKL